MARLRLALAIVAVLMLPMPFQASATEALGHQAETDAFADFMAVTRTAAERCPSVSIDQEMVDAIKSRLRIVDDDYFAFRRLAHSRAEALETELLLPGNLPGWCAGVFAMYGPEGLTLPNVLRK